MKACISQATTMTTPFAEDVSGYADGGCHAMEVWLTKLEAHLEKHPADETRQLLRDRQMTLAAASFQGGLLLSQGEQRRAHQDHYRRRLELCQYFGIPTIVLVADFLDRVDATGLQRAIVSLAEAARWAAAFDVRVGLEFHGRDTFCSCLETALLLAAQCGEPNVGVVLDVFHYYTGPSKLEDLAGLDPDRLALVQVCDVAGIPRELATDADRIFPGEGDFQLLPLFEHLRRIGYEGWVSLELLNPNVWQARPSQVAELGLGALRRLLEPSGQLPP